MRMYYVIINIGSLRCHMLSQSNYIIPQSSAYVVVASLKLVIPIY